MHLHIGYIKSPLQKLITNVCFFSSGPCMTLLLSKAGDTPDAADSAIDYFRDLIGPKDVNIAKEEAPAR